MHRGSVSKKGKHETHNTLWFFVHLKSRASTSFLIRPQSYLLQCLSGLMVCTSESFFCFHQKCVFEILILLPNQSLGALRPLCILSLLVQGNIILLLRVSHEPVYTPFHYTKAFLFLVLPAIVLWGFVLRILREGL